MDRQEIENKIKALQDEIVELQNSLSDVDYIDNHSTGIFVHTYTAGNTPKRWVAFKRDRRAFDHAHLSDFGMGRQEFHPDNKHKFKNWYKLTKNEELAVLKFIVDLVDNKAKPD